MVYFMFLPCVSHQTNLTTSHVSERTTFSLVELISISVFCFRFLQFHQTLQGLEVSFGICLRVLHCVHMTFPLRHSPVPPDNVIYCKEIDAGSFFSSTIYRYCLLCKVCHDSREGCNVSETAG